MATYYGAGNVDICAANAWESVQGGGGDTTFADGNAAGHTLDLDGCAMTSTTGTTLTCALLQAATGTLTPDGTLTITGKVKYTGTSTGGMIILGGGENLTIQPGTGAGTNAVENTSSGHCIVTSSTAVLTITNSGGTAISNSGTGFAVNMGSGSGAVTITGALVQTDGRCIAIVSTSTSHAITGDISSATASISATNAAVTLAGGTLAYSGNMSRTLSGICMRIAGGILNWTGTTALAANTDAVIYHTSGTANLGTSGTALTFTNSGRFAYWLQGGTLVTTYLTFTNQAATAQAAFLGQAVTVTGPTLPDEADVLEGSGAYGYAGGTLTPALEADDVLEASGGNYVGLSPDGADVRDGVTYGPSSAYEGNISLPIADNVRAGVGYGSNVPPNGDEFTGNVTFPAEEDVENGVQYGADGAEFTGTLPAYAYGSNTAAHVLTIATAAGTYQAVDAANVRKGVAVGVSPAVGTLVGCVDKNGNNQGASGILDADSDYEVNGTLDETGAYHSSGIIDADGTHHAYGIFDDWGAFYATGVFSGDGYNATSGLAVDEVKDGVTWNDGDGSHEGTYPGGGAALSRVRLGM